LVPGNSDRQAGKPFYRQLSPFVSALKLIYTMASVLAVLSPGF
jgi:hypothetical protein